MAISALILRSGVGPEATIPLMVLRGLNPGELGAGTRSIRHSVSPVPLRKTVSPLGTSTTKSNPT